MINNIIKKKKENILVLLTYLVLGLIYFWYAFVKGILLANGDAWPYFYPMAEYYLPFMRDGFPLWLPYEYLGLPSIGLFQAGFLYPLNVIYLIIPASYAFNISLILHYILAAFFTFLYARTLGIRTPYAFLSGIVFGFAGNLMAHRVYPTMVNASIWLPLLLYFYEKIKTTLNLKYCLWAAFIVTVQILAGNFQICVYTYMVLCVFSIFYIYKIEKGKRMKLTVFLALPMVLGISIALPQLIATKELTEYAWRVSEGYNFFTVGSLHPLMLLLLVFPFIFGGGFGDKAFWGKSVLAGGWTLNEYAGFTGILPLVTAIVVILKLWKKESYVAVWGVICSGAVFLALGQYNPFYKAMFYVPVYNLFRIPARHLLEFNLGIAILFGFGLNYLFNQRSEENRKLIRYIAWGVALVGVINIVLPYLSSYIAERDFLLNSLSSESQQLLAVLAESSSAENLFVYTISLGFIIIYLTCVYLFNRLAGRQKAIILIIALSVFSEVLVYGTFFNNEWNKIVNAERQIDNPVMHFLKTYSTYERNAFVSRDIISLSYVPAKVSALNGFEPLVIKDFRELLEAEYDDFFDWRSLLKKNLLLSMLNIRYVVVMSDSLAIGTGMNEYMASNKPQDIKQKEISLNNWDFVNMGKEKGEYIFKSPDSKQHSVMLHELSLKPNTSYMITFRARVEETDSLSKLNILFIKGDKNGDKVHLSRQNIQRIEIDPGYLKETAQTFSRVINIGSDDLVPKGVVLQTDSRDPIFVSDIIIVELSNYIPPYLGELEVGKESNSLIPLYRKVFTSEGTIVYENRNCLPKAFSVQNIEKVSDISQIKKKFDFLEFNPAETALVYEDELKKIGRTNFTKGDVKVTKYEADRVFIDADFKDTGFVVLAEQYYPGWRALIDGKEIPIYRVNGVLRGVSVPPGKHAIVFEYFPVKIYIAAAIGGVTLVICVLVLVIDYFRRKHNQEKIKVQNP